MNWLEEVVLVAALSVVPLPGGDVSAVLIENVVRFSSSPVSVLWSVVTLLPSPVSYYYQERFSAVQ